MIGFLRIHPIYDFDEFPENGNSDNGYFSENMRFSSKMTIKAQK